MSGVHFFCTLTPTIDKSFIIPGSFLVKYVSHGMTDTAVQARPAGTVDLLSTTTTQAHGSM